jgi:hypothetical protein
MSSIAGWVDRRATTQPSLAELRGFKREWIAAVGELSLANLKTRPDYAVTLRNVLVGFVEVKAPGKVG